MCPGRTPSTISRNVRIDQLLSNRQQPSFSFEFFPPKTPEGEQKLFETVATLRDLEPTYVSVTYGAGGGTRALTVDIVKRIKNELGIEAMAHFTCVGHTREELHDVLDEMRDAGIENIIALRGDPPKGETEFKPVPGGLSLRIRAGRADLASRTTSASAGACYPETHPDAPDADDGPREPRTTRSARARAS